jgi:hypothetical protein
MKIDCRPAPDIGAAFDLVKHSPEMDEYTWQKLTPRITHFRALDIPILKAG